MATRNISIREDVYKKLVEAKSDNESFSDIIDELLQKKGSLLPLWGSLSGSKGIEILKKESRSIREKARIRK